MEHIRKYKSLNPINISGFGVIDTGAMFKQYDINTSILAVNLLDGENPVNVENEIIYVSVRAKDKLVTNVYNKYSSKKPEEKKKILTRARVVSGNEIEIAISPLILQESGDMIGEILLVDLVSSRRITSQQFTFKIEPSLTPNRSLPEVKIRDVDGNYITDYNDMILLVPSSTENSFRINYTGTELNGLLDKIDRFNIDKNTEDIKKKFDGVELRDNRLVFLSENTEKQSINLPTLTGNDGATFIPNVSQEGLLSWENNKGLENPEPVNIKGLQGQPGRDGKDGENGKDGKPGRDGIDGVDGQPGRDGRSILFEWRGTELGIKKEGESSYNYVNLQGQPGINGQPGRDGRNGENGQSAYQIWLNSGNEGTEENFLTSLKGEDGKSGVTPNIQIGNVDTLEPNQQATVTKRGTDENPIFDFGIPRGQNGEGGTGTNKSDVIVDFSVSGLRVVKITDFNISSGIFTGENVPSKPMTVGVRLFTNDIGVLPKELILHNGSYTLSPISENQFKILIDSKEINYESPQVIDITKFVFEEAVSGVEINSIKPLEEGIYRVHISTLRTRGGQTSCKLYTNNEKYYLNSNSIFDGKPILYLEAEGVLVIRDSHAAIHWRTWVKHSSNGTSPSWYLGTNSGVRDFSYIPEKIENIRFGGAYLNGSRFVVQRMV